MVGEGRRCGAALPQHPQHRVRQRAFAAVLDGVGVLDASAGGIGGCPFAPKATGSIATDDLVYLLDRMGVRTGLDLEALLPVAAFLADQLGHQVQACSPAQAVPLSVPSAQAAAQNPPGQNSSSTLVQEAGLGGEVEDGVAAPDHARPAVGGLERRPVQPQLGRPGGAAGGRQHPGQPGGREQLGGEAVAEGGPAVAQQGQPPAEPVGVGVLGQALGDRGRGQARVVWVAATAASTCSGLGQAARTASASTAPRSRARSRS